MEGGCGGGVTWSASFSASRDVCSSAHRPFCTSSERREPCSSPTCLRSSAASAAPSFPAAAAAAAAVAIANWAERGSGEP